MARKHPDDYRHITVALDREAQAALTDIIQHEDRTVRSAVERAIRLYAAQMRPARHTYDRLNQQEQ